jgi:hypothetical protein
MRRAEAGDGVLERAGTALVGGSPLSSWERGGGEGLTLLILCSGLFSFYHKG